MSSIQTRPLQLELSFAEIFNDSSGGSAGITSPGQRVFDVLVNGETVITNLDLFARAPGANTIIERTVLATTNADGEITISLAGQGNDQPKINAHSRSLSYRPRRNLE